MGSIRSAATGWEVLRTNKELRQRFNLDQTCDYSTMLMRAMMGSSHGPWDVRWYWTVFKSDGVVLFPPISLVRNTGFDGSGTHGRGFLRQFSKAKLAVPSSKIDLPNSVFLDAGLYSHVKRALWRQNGKWIGKTIDKLRWWNTVHSYNQEA